MNNQFRSISTAIFYFCAPQLAQLFLKKITEKNKKPSVSSQTIIYVINFSGLLFKLHTASGSLIFCFKLDCCRYSVFDFRRLWTSIFVFLVISRGVIPAFKASHHDVSIFIHFPLGPFIYYVSTNSDFLTPTPSM